MNAKVNETSSMKSSKLWRSLLKEYYHNINDKFISYFREPNKKINRFTTNRPPKEPTYRYYLTILFNEIRKQKCYFFNNYRKLGNTNLGRPLGIVYDDLKINFDYLISLYEYDFISQNIKLNKIRSVVEIGAGFGRTAHTLLKLQPNIKSYTIIDLPPILKISKVYLQKVIPDSISKINFISAYNIKEWKQIKSELAINIDSFQEMPKCTIKEYLKNLFSNINYVYIKNPVCKYDPKLLGINSSRKFDVFSLGLMKEIVNIYNEKKLIKIRKVYNKRYCPSNKHKIIKSLPCNLYPYYQNTLYKKKTN